MYVISRGSRSARADCGRRRQRHQQRVRLAALRLGEQRRAGRRADVRRPRELEVARGRNRPVGERQAKAMAGRLLDVDAVVGARELREREARAQVDRDLHRIHVAVVPVGDRRRDAVRVEHLLRGGRPAETAAGRLDGRARDVARRDRQREAQPERAVVVAQRLLVLDRDDDLLARADVRDARREHVRPLLLDQRRLAAFGLRGLVGAPRLAALLDHAFDHALADLHAQVVDGGLLRQRKHVDAFAPLARRVHEALRDLHARDDPAHVHRDVGEEERRGGARAARVLQVQRAGAGVRGGAGRCGRGARTGAACAGVVTMNTASTITRLTTSPATKLSTTNRANSRHSRRNHATAGDPIDVCHCGSRSSAYPVSRWWVRGAIRGRPPAARLRWSPFRARIAALIGAKRGSATRKNGKPVAMQPACSPHPDPLPAARGEGEDSRKRWN